MIETEADRFLQLTLNEEIGLKPLLTLFYLHTPD